MVEFTGSHESSDGRVQDKQAQISSGVNKATGAEPVPPNSFSHQVIHRAYQNIQNNYINTIISREN